MKGRDYKKLRWFFTSNDLLVIGGKNARQNEFVVKTLVKPEEMVMHTKAKGSSFVVIKARVEKIKPIDLEQAAIFCACFSQEWKRRKKKSEVHIFRGEQLIKEKGQPEGTFTVIGKIRKKSVPLKLYLVFQKKILRGVPAVKEFKEKALFELKPGKIKKEKIAEMIKNELERKNEKINLQEIMQAIPAGGSEIKIMNKNGQ